MTNAVANALEAVLDEAYVRHHDSNADETFVHCQVCEEWEDHEDDCPIPVIEKWLEKSK